MERAKLWRGVFLLGLVPLLLPLVLGLYHAGIESWSVGEWVLLYSVLYWPTYLIGLGLMLLAALQLKRRK